LGKWYLAQQRFDQAEKFLEKAVRLEPSLEEAYYSYGLACVRNGKNDKGESILKSYQRKKAIRQSQKRGGGMASTTPKLPIVDP
jgi:cytochrome c-type biogenesis protein CcmH/NrfG